MSNPPCSLSFHNFWPAFDPYDNFFTRALSGSFDVQVGASGADVQISSAFGKNFPDPDVGSRPLCVWFSGEPVPARDRIFDLYFGFCPIPLLRARSFRYPLWIMYIDWWKDNSDLYFKRLLQPRNFQRRDKFCNFIYSAPISLRSEFFLRLSEYKRVDGLGGSMNTTGYRVKDKLAAMRGYRFAMAFENDIAPGYVTEKLLEALAAGCIPIYWGSEEAVRDFNPKAFIFAPAFSTFDEVIAHIKTIEETPDLMRKMAEEPIFTNNEIPFHHTPAFFAEEIKKALDNKLGNLIPTDWNAKMQAQLPREHKKVKRNVSYIKRELKRYLKLNS